MPDSLLLAAPLSTKRSRARFCVAALAALVFLCAVPPIFSDSAPPDQPAAGKSETAATSPVLRAVGAGNLAELNKALDSGAAFDATDSYGRTPLMIAAALGRADLVQPLIIKGSDMGQRDKAGRTALDYSRAAGNLPLFKNRSVLFAQASKTQKIPNAARAFSTHRALWRDVLGAVLLARREEPAAQIAGILELPPNDRIKEGRSLIALLASAHKGDPQSLKRLLPVFDDAGLTGNTLARWKTLLRLIESGKIRDAERLAIRPEYKPIAENALAGFTQAALLLPGSVDDQLQVERLLTPPMQRERPEPIPLPITP